jgi:hypothetical protein
VLGEAGLTLVSQWMYQTAVSHKKSRLANASAASVAQSINHGVIGRMPTESKRLDLKVVGSDFFGEGEFLSVAYLLEPTQPTQEHERLTGLLARMNGVNTYWGDNFVPHLSVTTVAAESASQSVLDSFLQHAPSAFGFEPAKAVPDKSPPKA